MDVIVNASLSRIFFSIWQPVAVNILYFLVHAIDGFEGGYRRNTHYTVNFMWPTFGNAFDTMKSFDPYGQCSHLNLLAIFPLRVEAQ